MSRIATRVEYSAKCGKIVKKCDKCRKVFKNEPYAIKVTYTPAGKLSKEIRCWRCWHTFEVTELIRNRYPGMFTRAKYGPWYYLQLFSNQFVFPSTDGDFDPDW